MEEIIPPVGCILAQRLTSALSARPKYDYASIRDIVYGELSAIASEQRKGDWLEFPNGTTYEMTFTPHKSESGVSNA